MYSEEEKLDMYNVYIRSNRNTIQSCQNYAALYPERQQPHRTLFSRLARNLVSQSSFYVSRRRYHIADNTNEVNVLAQLEINPENSSRRISEECSISDSYVRKIIKKHKYHDYKYKRVQTLHPGDTERRLEFCNWFQMQLHQDERFPRKILWTDESLFTNAGIFNRKNTHYYAKENPHLIRETRPQIRYSLNVWAGILNDTILGPFSIDGYLNGLTYLNFLEINLEDILDELPLATIRNLEWYQQDGAAPHNAHIVKNYLDLRFRNSWMGTYGPVRWPARSPCLSPLDYFLWGTVKDKVYSTPTENEGHLRSKIVNAFDSISAQSIQKAVDEMDSRTNLCIRQNGIHFEQLM